MMRVAVIDDEPLARSGVVARLSAHADMVLAGIYDDGPSALAGLRVDLPDLAFIDVQMPGLSGLDVLAALPPPQRPLAVLLTAHDEFAVRAFELRAIDYLLKPIDDDRFAEALMRARQVHQPRRERASADAAMQADARDPHASVHRDRFAVRVGRRTLFIDAADVEWIEADGDYAVLHVGDRSYLVREPLQRLSEQLDPAVHLRIHRSAIVRVDHVAELQSLPNRDAMLRLRDGRPLRASRTYVDRLLASLHGRVR